jgi:hypothetical protein
MLFDVNFRQDPNPSLTYDVQDEWLSSEAVACRILRDQMVSMRNSVGLSVFDLTWIETDSPGNTQVVQLLVSPGEVPAGQPVVASWLSPAPGQLDWIGLYASGADVHNYLQYAYVNGATQGSHTFTAPSTPGQYVFRYLLNNGYTQVSSSVEFTVT